MLSIVAMAGQAKTLSHLREAIEGHARLMWVRNASELAHLVEHYGPDIIVLDIANAAQPHVRLTARRAIAARPATLIVLTARIGAADMRTIPHLRGLDIWDVVLVDCNSPVMTRRCLLNAAPNRLADLLVRRLVARRAPAWIRPFVERCTEHDGATRPNVQSLASVDNVRRETLARQWKARGVCRPQERADYQASLRRAGKQPPAGIQPSNSCRSGGGTNSNPA